MVVSCTTPSPHHLLDMTDIYNTILPCQTNKERLPHQLQRDNGSQLYHSFTSSSGRHIRPLQQKTTCETMVVSCTTPSPPHLAYISDLYNKRLLVKLIEKGLPQQLQGDNGSQLYNSRAVADGFDGMATGVTSSQRKKMVGRWRQRGARQPQ